LNFWIYGIIQLGVNNYFYFMSKKTKNIVPNTMNNNINGQNGLKEELERKFEQIKSQNAGLESEKISMKNRIDGIKSEILQEFYKFLQDSGVDLNNVESISQFTQKLEAQDPDFVVLLEFMLNGLAPQNNDAMVGGVPVGAVGATTGNAPAPMPGSTSTAVATGNMAGNATLASSGGNADSGSMFSRLDALKKRGIV
jgi:hypothetical protein